MDEVSYSNTEGSSGHYWTDGVCSVCGTSLMKLPAALKTIEDEAFYGNTAIECVEVSDKTESIGSKAFANSGLKEIRLPASVTSIAEDAFEGCENFVIIAPEGSKASEWAAGKEYSVRIW